MFGKKKKEDTKYVLTDVSVIRAVENYAANGEFVKAYQVLAEASRQEQSLQMYRNLEQTTLKVSGEAARQKKDVAEDLKRLANDFETKMRDRKS